MQLKNLLPVALAAVASAQSLTDALASQNSSLSTLNGILQSQPMLAGALSQLQNITILAPSNSALAAFLNSSAAAQASRADVITAILQYHVLNGTYASTAIPTTPAFIPTLLTNASYTNVTGGQRVEVFKNGTTVDVMSGLLQQSKVVTADVKFNGGVIHVIDTVLVIPQPPSVSALAGNLTSLASALNSTGLLPTLDGLKDVTIFAPSNAAFGAIGSALSNITNDVLTSILTYHVVQGTVGYSSLLSNTTLKTVNGGNVTITVEGGAVFVNSARVIIPDILVSNGVAHVIDNVLNPNSTAVSVTPSATMPATVAFSGASSVTSMPASGSATGTGSASSVSKAGAAQAMQTGAIAAGALFAGAGVLLGNL